MNNNRDFTTPPPSVVEEEEEDEDSGYTSSGLENAPPRLTNNYKIVNRVSIKYHKKQQTRKPNPIVVPFRLNKRHQRSLSI